MTSLARIGTPECAAAVLPGLRSDDSQLRAAARCVARDADGDRIASSRLHRNAIRMSVCWPVISFAANLRKRPAACSAMYWRGTARPMSAPPPWKCLLKPVAPACCRCWHNVRVVFRMIHFSRLPSDAGERLGLQRWIVTDPAQVTEEEFRRLAEFLYRHARMVFTESENVVVERRITERMAATASNRFKITSPTCAMRRKAKSI